MPAVDLTALGPEGMAVVRLLVAALLGGVLGWERERRGRPAGLRTYILVSTGSALFTLASVYGFSGLVPGAPVDPSRVAAQIVTGIGFLGAGTILRTERSVFGLTTAAGIWIVAAIGMVAALGLYLTAIFATALAFVVLMVLRRFEERHEHLGED